MNDKERLEQIRKRFSKTLMILGRQNGKELFHGDIDWLFQQAELYHLTNEQLSPKLAKLNKFLQERHTGDWGKSVVDIAMDLILELEKENNLLKECLEFYANEDSYCTHWDEENDIEWSSHVISDGGSKARRLLGEYN